MDDIDFFTPGARLALELECLLLDTRDAAVQSRWWASAHEALEQWRQAIRAMEAAIDVAQPQASTTLEEAASHARVCSGLAEQHKDDAVLYAALTDAAAIIRDLMRSRLQESRIADPVHSDRALRLADDAAESVICTEGHSPGPKRWTITREQIKADPYLDDALAHLEWRGLAEVHRAEDGVTVVFKEGR